MAQAFALSGTNLISFNTASPTATTTTAITASTPTKRWSASTSARRTACSTASASTPPPTPRRSTPSRRGPVLPASSAQCRARSPSPLTAARRSTLPDPATVGWGFDFNPAADRIRVVAGSLNFRVNPNTGAAVDGDNGGDASPAPTPTARSTAARRPSTPRPTPTTSRTTATSRRSTRWMRVRTRCSSRTRRMPARRRLVKPVTLGGTARLHRRQRLRHSGRRERGVHRTPR